MTDVIPFLRALLTDPQRTGAVVPSGPALAALMTREITPESAPVIELGPGTGVFTRALLSRRIPAERITAVEYRADFAAVLRQRYPGVNVLCMDASKIGGVELFGGEPAGAVVSGLPLLSLDPRRVMGVLSGAFAHLRPDAALYQFTYAMRCPVTRRILDRLGLRATRVGCAVANLPPAEVYRIERR